MSTQPVKIQAMIMGLIPIATNCLASLLKYFVTDREFVDDKSRKFRTAGHHDKALSEYLKNKPSVVNAIYGFIQNKDLIFEEGRKVSQIIKVYRLDISMLRLLLLNVVDFVTCLGDVKNSPRQSECNDLNHETNIRCCNACDHPAKHCTECHEAECKDNSNYICCTACKFCVNCSRLQATPPCINYVLRRAILIIANMRNLKSHSTEDRWKEIANESIPREFKFCGNTSEDIWKACEEAVRKVLNYLKSEKIISVDEYNKKDHSIYQLQHLTESEQLIIIANSIVESSLNISQQQKSLKILILVKNVQKTSKSFWKRLVSNNKKQNKLFQENFGDERGLDSPIVLTIVRILKQAFKEELQPRIDHSIQDYKIYPTSENSQLTNENCKEDTFKLIVAIKPMQNDPNFVSLYEECYSDHSNSLWKRFTDDLYKDVLSAMGLEIDIVRKTWELGSIVTTVLITKKSGKSWNIIEKNNVLTLIAEVGRHPRSFGYSYTAKFGMPENNELECVSIHYSVDIYKEELLQVFMDIYPGFEGRLKARFDALKEQLEANYGLYQHRGIYHFISKF